MIIKETEEKEIQNINKLTLAEKFEQCDMIESLMLMFRNRMTPTDNTIKRALELNVNVPLIIEYISEVNATDDLLMEG